MSSGLPLFASHPEFRLQERLNETPQNLTFDHRIDPVVCRGGSQCSNLYPAVHIPIRHKYHSARAIFAGTGWQPAHHGQYKRNRRFWHCVQYDDRRGADDDLQLLPTVWLSGWGVCEGWGGPGFRRESLWNNQWRRQELRRNGVQGHAHGNVDDAVEFCQWHRRERPDLPP